MRTLTMPSMIAAILLAGAAPALALRAPQLEGRFSLNAPLDVITPAEWSGVWEVVSEVFDCESGLLFFSDSYLDTLCTDQAIDFEFDEGMELDCTSSADGSSLTMQCSGEEEVYPGCTAQYAWEFSAVRTGDAYESTAIISTTYVGELCEFVEESCMRIEAAGTRIAPEPSSCNPTPLEAMPWGSLKAMYR